MSVDFNFEFYIEISIEIIMKAAYVKTCYT